MMKYAIVESGGKQYKAVEGGTLEVDRLPVEAGARVILEQVLLLAEEGNITVGVPVVKDSPVWTTVLEHFKGKKVTIFNYSPKKRIRVKTGHRQNYTRLLVEQIGGSELIAKAPVVKAVKEKKGEERLVEAVEPSPKKKDNARKPAAKPVTAKPAKKPVKAGEKPARATEKPAKTIEKPAKSAAKPAKSGTKKPAASEKKSAAKK
jgi:large subunit ribosomal protein L21